MLSRTRAGIIGDIVIDSSLGAAAIPFAAAVIPVLGVFFILHQERKVQAGVTEEIV